MEEFAQLTCNAETSKTVGELFGGSSAPRDLIKPCAAAGRTAEGADAHGPESDESGPLQVIAESTQRIPALQ